MNKIIITEELRKEIVLEYNLKRMPMKDMWKKFNIGYRPFYRILKEEGIELKNKPRNYHKLPKNNLVGKRFHHLVVEKMEFTNKSTGKTYRCICKCDCGRIADVSTNNLMRGLRKTCGDSECIYHRQDYTNFGKHNVKFTGYEEISGMLWAQYKNGASSRNLEFNITLEYVWGLFIKQNRKCALSGRNIFFGKTTTKEKTASLDRIDSTKGYIIGNVQWVHKNVNIIKSNLDNQEFINLCVDVANYNKNL